MKLSKIFGLMLFAGFIGNAMAANITVYYSPTCPHCHHARDFIKSELIYVYNDLKVEEVNVMETSNRQRFFDTVKKCGYESGGVPVMVIGEKCFQGYADSMQQDIRDAIEIDLSAEQKKSAESNKKEFDKDKQSFVASHSDRVNAVVDNEAKKKLNKASHDYTNISLFVIIILLVAGLGVLLFKKQK